jgi:2-polyprenyl-3-methyl-5-hydroxy-6-metoxy-1,4-benzoquinol methylase
MTIRYEPHANGLQGFEASVRDLIARRGIRRVCEVGAGANPILSLDMVREHGLEYVTVDASAEELAKAPEGYTKIQADVTSPGFSLDGNYELVFSKFLAEHVADGEVFHRNVYRLLAPGGLAYHFFPTLFAFPFVVNRLLPDRLSEAILLRMFPGRAREGHHGKFVAHYNWCRGPHGGQIRRLQGLGYEVEEYVGYFGHGYFQRIGPLHRLQESLTRRRLRRPNPLFTSYASVLLRRPR